jgi:hypothetical protein
MNWMSYMGDKNSDNGILDEKMDQLNRILLDLIQDANDLTEDLINGIHLNFIMGTVSIVFAIQLLWYNRVYISNGDIVPLILSLIMIASGLLIINRGFQLRGKYSRLYQARKQLRQI